MSKRIFIHLFLALILILYALLIEHVYSFKILSYGPTQTLLGKDFNVQPSGESALWIKTRGELTKSVKLKWDNLILDTKINIEECLVSAKVPRQLYETEGKHTLCLFDEKDNNSSNKVFFNVTN